MTTWLIYLIITALLLAAELVYFRIADKCNIIDKPNQRSSHSSIVLRGGGIIFVLGLWIWAAFFGFQNIWFLIAVTLVAGVSFIDDIHSLPDSVRLVAQFAAMALMFYQLDMLHWNMWWIILLAMIVCVGASNIINFMDGVNGITGAYAMASLLPLFLLNKELGFADESLIAVVALADIVFCFFNFRPKGKAKCFAGDVGSIGVAYILLFLIGSLILATGDVTYLIFLLVYGVDGCLTICHRILLHENLGEAHRKHAYQLMANELRIGHVKVASFYALLQLAVSLGFIYLCPALASATGLSLVAWHWIYLAAALALLALAYVLFKKKYYHLHEEYLASLK
ncbi:MAG: glycosyltransferase family 4 protein [Prevotella sp.]|nr:glycosyltransferase family 4 protein [Prevotella sp.]